MVRCARKESVSGIYHTSFCFSLPEFIKKSVDIRTTKASAGVLRDLAQAKSFLIMLWGSKT